MLRNWPQIVIITILSTVIIGQYIAALEMESTSKKDYVYTVCMDAHGETNGFSEAKCGEAQDKTNTIFMCSTINNCWVEEL